MTTDDDAGSAASARKFSGAFRVGLTGGIASGKSTVANMFAELGAELIDTDVIARQVVTPGTDGLRALVEHFGDRVLSIDGSLDRRELRHMVFADAEKRRELESIVHPRIRAETERLMDLSQGSYQLIVIPLLVESPLKDRLDRILVVDCSEQVQLERLLRRDAETEQQARRMIAAQASREQRLAIADDVIGNDGSTIETQRQVSQLHEKYLSLAAAIAQ